MADTAPATTEAIAASVAAALAPLHADVRLTATAVVDLGKRVSALERAAEIKSAVDAATEKAQANDPLRALLSKALPWLLAALVGGGAGLAGGRVDLAAITAPTVPTTGAAPTAPTGVPR